jgi:hypothetical protein
VGRLRRGTGVGGVSHGLSLVIEAALLAYVLAFCL